MSNQGNAGQDHDSAPPDPLGEAIAAFLSDLLDNTSVSVHTDIHRDVEIGETRLPTEPIRGADDRLRQFSLRSTISTTGDLDSASVFPRELADLPAAALRALERMAQASVAADQIQPSLARALHDVVVVEVLADRLMRRLSPDEDPDAVTTLVAETLDYTMELAATQIEGKPVTHGVVLCADRRGRQPVEPRLEYPGRLPTRKRTPLLFDGTESVLAVAASGAALGEMSRASLPEVEGGRTLETFDTSLGIGSALTAAASAAFQGVGVLLRSDRSIWIFDEGEPLFIRRTNRWKSIAVKSFVDWLASIGETTPGTATVLAQAVLRASIQATGALYAVAPDRTSLGDLVSPKDMVPTGVVDSPPSTVDDELHTLLAGSELGTPAGLARLARLDGATVIDRRGEVLAYAAIVRSADSRGEGARTAAARALSLHANLAVSVSEDGPVSVFHRGEVVLELL